ncbi:xenotropic and polytropic murine leukemia virus receptor xpr1 [Capsaspora owczarzaki ATCC 30864]|uniref:Xenotropic and polytropic murine leukemia virus receptor xpr1 n=1 Tax=Capsaspora owczarzaki (strain ATCC 30864) TaxID=595528 RepID=A0A0D2WK61_CAPO3|nr:xenotropic and polytropic murine leukemia virus receptor xpr1 [Capsaspora owczarzaki ATCC 30864]KJE90575.1 xenotropic and polytropic murine leukemia virus receptor xpr1 [Capsaspora owczarzaki ATCC 30864]|eukprot:XP_004364741.2 xenotropic and polytropic murine leukemia virus receptor xpr1 [Capsaspora owczarzaki ATCC 30864]
MKFAKYLDQSKLGEWSSQYVGYRKMKKQLKRIGLVATIAPHSSGDESAAPKPHDDDTDSQPALQPDQDAEQFYQQEAVFVQMFDAEVGKVNAFFSKKMQEAITQQKELQNQAKQLTQLAHAPETILPKNAHPGVARGISRGEMLRAANEPHAGHHDAIATFAALAETYTSPAGAMAAVLSNQADDDVHHLTHPQPPRPEGPSSYKTALVPPEIVAANSARLSSNMETTGEPEKHDSSEEDTAALHSTSDYMPRSPEARAQAAAIREDKAFIRQISTESSKRPAVKSALASAFLPIAAGVAVSNVDSSPKQLSLKAPASLPTGAVSHSPIDKARQSASAAALAVEPSPPSVQAKQHRLGLATVLHSPNRYKVALRKLSAAIAEHYRFLDILRNYHILNHTALAKILKKHDKTTGFRTLAVCMDKLKNEPFMKLREKLSSLMEDCEKLYSDAICDGDRRAAMRRLRLVDEETVQAGSAFRLGLLGGMCIPLFILVIIAVSSRYADGALDDFQSIWLMYRGMLLPIYMLWLVAGDIWIWQKRKINYAFIFDFNVRDHLNFVEVAEVAGFLSVFWCVSILCYTFSDSISFIPARWNPLALASFYVLFMFNPFPIFRRSARYWTLRTFGRVIVSPLTKVRFADFWFGDQLISLVVALLDWEFLFCYYITSATSSSRCVSVSYGVRPVITCLPAFWRLMQCLRRYRDTKAKFPHLVNAGKYSATIMVGIFSSLDAYYRESHPGSSWNAFRTIWVICASISAVYSYTWDIKMDWGLTERKYKFLRKELVYYPKFVYYFAMVLDLALRFLWTFTIAPQQNIGNFLSSQIFLSVLAFLEVSRRCMWNIFRLENEHLNNCGQFRVIHDVPLPFRPLKQDEEEVPLQAAKLRNPAPSEPASELPSRAPSVIPEDISPAHLAAVPSINSTLAPDDALDPFKALEKKAQ